MVVRRILALGCLMAMFSPLAGCATIFSDHSWPVTIDNSGGSTYFVIKDRQNQVVEAGVTPKELTLKSSAGPFRPARYHVEYAGESGVDHQTLGVNINWWTAGNILMGGIPGLLVDAGTGAMWRLEPSVVGEVPHTEVVSNREQGHAIVANGGPPSVPSSQQESAVRSASFSNSQH